MYSHAFWNKNYQMFATAMKENTFSKTEFFAIFDCIKKNLVFVPESFGPF